MSLVATGIQVNCHGVQFVYGTGPTTVSIPEVKDLTISRGGDRLAYQGDDAPGDAHQIIVNRTRTVKLNGAARSTIAGIPQGVKGTLTWIEDDFENAASTGSFNGTLANCMFNTDDTQGAHNEVRMNEATFTAHWTKNTATPPAWVDPLSYTVTA